MRLPLTLAVVLWATQAAAGVEEAIDRHALPATAAFVEGTAALAAAAEADCRAEALRPAFQSAFDAWMGISHLDIGPLEEEGRNLAISFWPDSRGMVPRTVARLLADEDPAVRSRDAFAQVSVAARGFFGLEQLLYQDDLSDYGRNDYACAYARAIAVDLARLAEEIDAAWRGDFGESLRTAGAPGNAQFLTRREGLQALYGALDAGLAFDADRRLGRPLGTFDRPRPERAEAWRSGRSLRNLILSLRALDDLARHLADAAIPQTEARFANVLDLAERLDDPVFAGTAEPQGRLKVEILQQRVNAVRQGIIAEIGEPMQLRTRPFNRSEGGD